MPSFRSRRSLQIVRQLAWLTLAFGACVNLAPPWQPTSKPDAASVQGTGGRAEPGGTGGASDATSTILATGGALASGDGGALGSGGLQDTGGSLATLAGEGGAGGDTGGMAAGGTSAVGGSGGAGGDSGGAGGDSGGAGGDSGGAGGAGGAAAGGASGSLACASDGKPDDGICWYYGAAGASCTKTCTDHGGVSPQAPSHVGVAAQGGSLTECARLFKLLGMTGSVYSATRSDGAGVGCHMYPGGSRVYFWLTSPSYSNDSCLASARIVCGCRE